MANKKLLRFFLIAIASSCKSAHATDCTLGPCPSDAYLPVWRTGGSKLLSLCAAYTDAFGVVVCLSTAAKQYCDAHVRPTKCDHIVNVLLQLLDNDADGAPDDATLVQLMSSSARPYMLIVPLRDDVEDEFFDEPAKREIFDEHSVKEQITGLFEAFTGSCDAPRWRGASPTERSTWPAARAVGGLNCEHQRDATPEEVLHLITEAVAVLYPHLWASSRASSAGSAVLAANGDCGWGYLGNWQDPSSDACTGQYAYDDPTCLDDCIVIEGIYWAIASYTGGLYTDERADWISNEWLMATPDAAFPVEPPEISNAVSLQAGSPALYALVSDHTSHGHKWLPAVWPDGLYVKCPECCSQERPATNRRMLFASAPSCACPPACAA